MAWNWEELTPPWVFEENTCWSISTEGTNIVGTYITTKQDVKPAEYRGWVLPSSNVFEPVVINQNIVPNEATSARGVNETGDIVGFYRRSATNTQPTMERGFVKWNGEDPIDFNVAVADEKRPSWAFGINNDGRVVGMYYDQNGAQYGYISKSRLTGIQEYESVRAHGSYNTRTRGINSDGWIVGDYDDDSQGSLKTYGYVWVPDANGAYPVGNFRKCEILLANEMLLAKRTVVTGINDRKWIVGNYEVMDDEYVGFLWKIDNDGWPIGVHQDIHFPTNWVRSQVSGISNGSQIVGIFRDKNDQNKLRKHAYRTSLLSAPAIDLDSFLLHYLIDWRIERNRPRPWPPPSPYIWGLSDAGRNAMLGLLVHEIAGMLSDEDIGQRISSEVLEMVAREVKELQKIAKEK